MSILGGDGGVGGKSDDQLRGKGGGGAGALRHCQGPVLYNGPSAVTRWPPTSTLPPTAGSTMHREHRKVEIQRGNQVIWNEYH